MRLPCAGHPRGETEFLKLKMSPFWGLVRKAEHGDGLQKVSLCVTHDARAPGKPESGTTLPRGPGMLVWFGRLCI